MAPSLIVLSRVIHVTLLFLCSVPPETRECVRARLLPTHPYGSASNEAFTRAVGRNFLNIAQKKTIRLSRLIKPRCFLSNPTAGDLFLLCLFVNEVLCSFFFPPPSLLLKKKPDICKTAAINPVFGAAPCRGDWCRPISSTQATAGTLMEEDFFICFVVRGLICIPEPMCLPINCVYLVFV